MIFEILILPKKEKRQHRSATADYAIRRHASYDSIDYGQRRDNEELLHHPVGCIFGMQNGNSQFPFPNTLSLSNPCDMAHDQTNERSAGNYTLQLPDDPSLPGRSPRLECNTFDGSVRRIRQAPHILWDR